MDFFLRSFETYPLAIAATVLFAVLIAATMGLFSKNQMPVEGKVRFILHALHTFPRLTHPTRKC